MAAVNPYLNFNGNCEEAFNFYKSVFGGDFAMLMRFKDAPKEAGGADSNPQQIMHVALPIGKGTMIMGSDVPEHYGKIAFGQNVQISITADSKKEADNLFNGLSAGGKVTLPMGQMFWGSYFGMFADKFDIQWMVSFDDRQGS